MLPPGAARNAVDCALWDLEAKISGKRAWELADFVKVHCSRRPVGYEHASAQRTALQRGLSDLVKLKHLLRLVSITPEAMATAAKAVPNLPILKLKLGGDHADVTRVEAVREAAPKARLLVDANESWTPDHYLCVVPSLVEFGVELIEQPFPADANNVLETLDHPIPVCADESCHTTADLPDSKSVTKSSI